MKNRRRKSQKFFNKSRSSKKRNRKKGEKIMRRQALSILMTCLKTIPFKEEERH
jgi:hypothetical protein